MKGSDITVAFLGCGTYTLTDASRPSLTKEGNMGSAVLAGLLEALYPEGSTNAASSRISQLIACTNSETSAKKLEQQLGRHRSRVEVLHKANLEAMQRADVIVLGVKPYFAKDVLQEDGVREAVAGKLIMSMIPGSVTDLGSYLAAAGNDAIEAPWLVKTIPNIAARYGQSMTLIDPPEPSLPREEQEFMKWFWNQIGSSKTLTSSTSNAGMMTMTAVLAGLSVSLEGVLDGSVREGLRRTDAMDIALQSMKSLVSILESGTHPAAMRESIASPRGCTIAALLSLEKAGVRGTFAQALIDGAEVFADKK
ncbi:uncharacterized protein JN550_008454 [Neoarthrinium moseri]|uniref:uncharacterized protein n=1 Tax=Neoarthrinium moseri TaxID=1658444 RepID=UPI001FDD55A7|nr:uncharacterized protein JN550_008454 [Neoarthrinium moseri]KAI1865406.1 hypothetical protein JN550_008454 [Neoarthrinium moseri]